MRLLPKTHPLAAALIRLFSVLFFLADFTSAAGTVDLAWSANTENDIAGYKVLYGTTSGSYTQEQNVGLTPAATLTGLLPGTTYYCTVQAVTTAALYSPSSDEISFTVAQVTTPEISLELSPDALLADGQSSVDFGDISIQSTSSHTISVRNLGTATLSGLSLTLDGTDAASFGLSSNIPFALLTSPNGSFESELAGWTASGNVRVIQNAAATSGASLVEFNSAETQPNGLLTQTFATVAGTTYTLSFDAGVLSFNSNTQIIKTIVTGSGPLLSKSVTLTGPSDGSTRWSSQSFTFVADSSSTTLAFADLSTTSAAIDLRLDNVRVIAQSPQGAISITSLAPGASTTFDVTCKPSTVGKKSAAIHLTSNDADENPFDFSITASITGLPEISVRQSPAIELTDGAASVNFSNSVIGTRSAAETLIIQNTGTANLTNLAVTTDGAEVSEFVVGPLAKTSLAPGESTTLQVSFLPTTSGTKSAAIHIASNDADENPFDIALIGNGLAVPRISVFTPGGTSLINNATLPQGSVNLGTAGVSQVITVRNTGTGNLTGISLSMDGSNPADFLIEAPTTSALAPGSAVDFKITFKPTAAGERTAAIHIASNDSEHSPFNLQLTGGGIANPEIAVTLDDANSLVDGVSTAAFGNVNIGSIGTARTFTISNTGTAALTGILLATDGSTSDFIVSGISSATLAPGASTRFTIVFKPTAAGARSAAIHIASNDADENPFDIKLTGIGVAVPEIAIDQMDVGNLVSGSATIVFGNANIATTGAVKSFTVRNLGSASLTNLAITRDGANAADFAVDGLPNATLAPGASLTFQVVFKPTAAGARTAAIHITSNDADESPYHISLSGTGIAVPEISITRADNSELIDGSSTLTSGNVNLGSTGATQIITIRNTGTGNLTNLAISKNGAHASDFTVSAPAATLLAPGGSTTFTLTFTPSAPGARTAAIHIASNDADENLFDIKLEGIDGVVSVLAIGQSDGTWLARGETSADLGSAIRGSTSPAETFTLKNIGTAPLTGLQLVSSGEQSADFIVSPLPETTLAPGASTSFQVSFKPTAAGTRSATLQFFSDDRIDSAFKLVLSGTGIAIPEIAVSTLSAGNLTTGSAAVPFDGEVIDTKGDAQTFVIRNLGSAPLTNLAVSISGAHASDFKTTSLPKTTLDPGASASFKVFFTPSAAGARTATLQIASSDADESLFSISLSGTGIALPEISIKLNGGSNLVDDSAFLNFGSAALSRASGKKTLTITNLGTARLTRLSLLKNGLNGSDFTVSDLRVSSLAPGASTSVNVTFKPTTPGTRWATIHISSNDADEKSFDIVLTGKCRSSSASKRSTPIAKATAAPHTALSVSGIEVIDGKKYRTLTVTWPEGQRDMSRHIEVSSDLLTWSSGKKFTTVITHNSTTLKVRDNTPLTQNDKRYIRQTSHHRSPLDLH